MTDPATPPGMRYHPDVAARALAKSDPLLGRVIADVGPCTLRPEPGRTLFDRLASSIVSQQLSVKAAATIAGRLRTAAGDGPHLLPERVVRLTDDELRAAGLSRPKVAAMRDIADAVVTHRIPTMAELDGLDDEEVVAALVPVRGIGRWTVEMLLLFQLGRPDVFPLADVGVRRAIDVLHGRSEKCTPAEMLAASEPWAPYRSVASWYLWRSLEVVPDP